MTRSARLTCSSLQEASSGSPTTRSRRSTCCGAHARVQEVSEQVRKSRPRDGGTYLYLGELWEDKGETKRALGWFMRGIMLEEQSGPPQDDLDMLCLGRWRIRQRDAQEPDAYDEVALVFQQQLTALGQLTGDWWPSRHHT